MPKVKPIQPISSQYLLERIHAENTWWLTSEVESEFREKAHRAYFDVFTDVIDVREVQKPIVLMGPSQSGKSVFLRQTVQYLLKQGISPLKIALINLNTPSFYASALEDVTELVFQATANQLKKDGFIIIDNVHYSSSWYDELLSLASRFPEITFIVSSSVNPSFYPTDEPYSLSKIKEFVLPPITFAEFLSIRKMEQLILPSTIEWRGAQHNFYAASNIKELNRQFIEYLNFGGFPSLVYSSKSGSESLKMQRDQLLKNYLLHDFPLIYGILNVKEMNGVFALLAAYSGQEFSLESLSAVTGVEKYLLRKYLEFLEAAFFIRVIHRVDEFAQKFSRANYFKVFLTNPSLRTLLYYPVEANDEVIPDLVATCIFSQWIHRYRFTPYYARWAQGEVSMLGIDERRGRPQGILEIKWTNQFVHAPEELKNLTYFCYQNEMDTAMVTTLDTEAVKEIDGLNLHFVPSAIYAYVVGINTLERSKKTV